LTQELCAALTHQWPVSCGLERLNKVLFPVNELIKSYPLFILCEEEDVVRKIDHSLE
jgi:hypothetical protein